MKRTGWVVSIIGDGMKGAWQNTKAQTLSMAKYGASLRGVHMDTRNNKYMGYDLLVGYRNENGRIKIVSSKNRGSKKWRDITYAKSIGVEPLSNMLDDEYCGTANE